MQRTTSAGLMSASSFHTGLRSAFAHRSHTEFTMAAVARCIAPLSGPIQRSCGSPVISRQKRPMSCAIASSVLPTTSGRSAFAARQRGPADNRGRDGVELVALAKRRLRRVEARRDEHAGEPAEKSAERIHGDLPAVDADAGEPRRFLVAPKREGEAAEDRLRE